MSFGVIFAHRRDRLLSFLGVMEVDGGDCKGL